MRFISDPPLSGVLYINQGVVVSARPIGPYGHDLDVSLFEKVLLNHLLATTHQANFCILNHN
jgi:hypothetical protein